MNDRDDWISAVMDLRESLGADLNPILRAYRDHELLGEIYAPEDDRDAGLFAAALMIRAWEADEVWLALDVCMTRTSLNPMTGEQWKEGELAELYSAGLSHKGQIVDALHLTFATPDAMNFMSIPYLAHDSKVVWLPDDQREYASEQVEGAVPDHLRKAFEMRPYLQEIESNPEHLVEHRARLAQGTLWTLGQLGFKIFLSGAGARFAGMSPPPGFSDGDVVLVSVGTFDPSVN